jgi:hypothetical protein
MEDVRAKIDQRPRQLDAAVAHSDPFSPEAHAADALDLAMWTVDNARLAMLDAIDARALADDRANAVDSLPRRATIPRNGPGDPALEPRCSCQGAMRNVRLSLGQVLPTPLHTVTRD